MAQRDILVDSASRAACNGTVAAEALGPIPLKGRAVPVDGFAVSGGGAGCMQ